MKFTTFLFSLLLSLSLSAQTTYFIDQQNGSNNNNGTSVNTPFKSIESATDIAIPGDTISIIGTYTNSSYNGNYSYINDHDPHLWHAENSIKINELHGTSGNYITIRPYDQSTILKGDGANIFRVTNSSYLNIEGFEVQGEVSNIPISTAKKLQFVYIDKNTVGDHRNPTASEIRYRNEDCISNCTPDTVVDGEIYSDLSNLDVSRPSYTDTRGIYLSKVHHINIRNNTIYDMPGGGLRVSDCEDILIEENEVYACSRKSYSGTHALVVTKATSTRTTDDYRIRILRNHVHHNYNEIFSWAPTKTIITPHIDEGKGISLQRNETTYNSDGSINVDWENGRILVQNNMCYFNGFSGVHSNDGYRIDIVNNTCYFNSYTKSITANEPTSNGGNIGISAQGGGDIRIINNISIIDLNLNKSAIASNLTSNEGLVVRNNLIYGTDDLGATGPISEDADVVAVQTNTYQTDPLFTDATNFDFSLQSTSLAIDSADTAFAPLIDYNATIRDQSPDLGALEYQSTLEVPNKNQKLISNYPNPTKGIIYLTHDQANMIKVYNNLGQNMKHKVYATSKTLDLSALRDGVYILELNGVTQRIVKSSK